MPLSPGLDQQMGHFSLRNHLLKAALPLVLKTRGSMRSASENHTFSKNARTHRVCQPNPELSPTRGSVTHCAAPLHHGKCPAGWGLDA
ncbi:hypothetical protein EYF80_058795 [Liparis tanakae]|uniref:Uncharacterized protein n=1 Tax=Liparis tanakae TaxID=230148 RepID=A0A4Z2EQI5_9TELE|nr:hypothetical protein EYF80_058795 [Liparis tanakae]